MKHYIVAVDSGPADESNSVSEMLTDRGCAWWHWIDNFWIVIDQKGVFTATSLRDAILEITHSRNLLVFEIKSRGSWAGFGPSSKKRNSSTWLKKWRLDPPPG